MFTGIVQGRCVVAQVGKRGDVVALKLKFPGDALTGVAIGASISIHGCCLSVVAFDSDHAHFELVPETVSRGIFEGLHLGDELHFERSLKFGDEVGGHTLSGHIDTTATVRHIDVLDGCKNITFEVGAMWMKYLLPKGYVSVDGASLTVADTFTNCNKFKVSLIPETLRVTAFDKLSIGDRVNIEIDRTTQAIVDTVERVLISHGISTTK